MNHEDQGKKMSPAEKLPAGKDDKVPVPAKPTALSDADLDNVAGGVSVPVCGDTTPETNETFSRVAPASLSSLFIKK